MPKSLSSFLEDCRREIPNEVVHVHREVDPAHLRRERHHQAPGRRSQVPRCVVFDRAAQPCTAGSATSSW